MSACRCSDARRGDPRRRCSTRCARRSSPGRWSRGEAPRESVSATRAVAASSNFASFSASRRSSKLWSWRSRKQLDRALEIVVRHREAQLDGVFLELLVKAARVERACALVEHRRHHVAGAGLALGVFVGAAEEREVQRDQRQRCVAHQPGLDAARRGDALDVGGMGRPAAPGPWQQATAATAIRLRKLRITSVFPPSARCP